MINPAGNTAGIDAVRPAVQSLAIGAVAGGLRHLFARISQDVAPALGS